MAHPIDSTLAILQDVMTAHRQALTRSPSSGAASTLNLPRSPRADLILRLLVGVEARAGIEVSQMPADKLLRAFASVDMGALTAWVTRLEGLPASHPEWLELIETLTVHETYVMRDPAQMQFFAAQLPEMIAEARKKAKRLRFWSVGCATGEEAYSIAALVFDALVEEGEAVETPAGIHVDPGWQIEVLGSDISRNVLNRARAGVYPTGPLSSFRAESIPLLRHFPAAAGVAESARIVGPHLKGAARFAQFNLVEDPLPETDFDAVFCRNVLIYFSARARRDAQDMLCRAVRPEGYLVLGPTDTLIETQAFDAVWGPEAVIYRRRRGHG